MTSTALLKLTEVKINDNTTLVNFIEKAKALTIPLFPETVQFTDPALKFGAAIVTVDVNNDKDIYQNESGKYSLHLSKLNEIAQQAGIQVVDSKILERKVDEKGRVVFISHQVKGRLKSIDGSIKEMVVVGKYDYFRDCEKYAGKNKMINNRRTHAEAIAESNALTRLFTKLVSKLPTSFTLEELKKPFLIPYVIEDKDEILRQLPEEEQIAIKRDLVRQRLGLMNEIYNHKEEEVKQEEIINYIQDDNEEDEEDESLIEIEQQQVNEIKKNDAEYYRNVSQKERTEKILNLIKLKNYKDPKGIALTKERIEKNSLDNQIKFLQKLIDLPYDEVEL